MRAAGTAATRAPAAARSLLALIAPSSLCCLYRCAPPPSLVAVVPRGFPHPPARVQAADDLDQRQLFLGVIRRFHRLYPAVLRAFPYSLEARPSVRWFLNVTLACKLLALPVSPMTGIAITGAAAAPPGAGGAREAGPPDVADDDTVAADVLLRSLDCAGARAPLLYRAVPLTEESWTGIRRVRGTGAEGRDGEAPGGGGAAGARPFDAAAALDSVMPRALNRALVTRGLLHANRCVRGLAGDALRRRRVCLHVCARMDASVCLCACVFVCLCE